MNIDNVELDKELLAKLKMKIYLLEKENFKTKKIRDTDLIEKIRKLIQTEVNNNDNYKYNPQ